MNIKLNQVIRDITGQTGCVLFAPYLQGNAILKNWLNFGIPGVKMMLKP